MHNIINEAYPLSVFNFLYLIDFGIYITYSELLHRLLNIVEL